LVYLDASLLPLFVNKLLRQWAENVKGMFPTPAFDTVPITALHELTRKSVTAVPTFLTEDANVMEDASDGVAANAVLLAQLCYGDPVTAGDRLDGSRLPTEDLF
jgi:hypothetical protein